MLRHPKIGIRIQWVWQSDVHAASSNIGYTIGYHRQVITQTMIGI